VIRGQDRRLIDPHARCRGDVNVAIHENGGRGGCQDSSLSH
jgi:hypothetical protein